LTIDADGSAWVSTWSGLVRWKNHQMKTLTSQNGLPCDAIVSAIRDDHATLWLYTKCGFIAIADSELEQWWQQPNRIIDVRVLDVFDGAVLPAGPRRFQPAVSKSADGRLWFVNGAVVQMIDPNALRTNRVPPPVYVEEVRADRKDYPTGGLVRLPARSRDIEIGYTALSFSTPQKVRFRYKLEGRDQDWQDAGTRRQVFYSDLPPGQYRFHVTASNNDGVWNESGAVLDLSIMPTYYQTRWFQALVMASLFGVLWVLYWHRVRGLTHEYSVRLEERVEERTRIARDLHDTLLQSFQGLMLRLQVVDDILPDGKAKHQLEQVLERADQAIAEGRNTVYDLRRSAITTNDLAEAVKAVGEELTTQDSAAFRVVVEGATRDLNPILRDEVYRIMREALRNAFAHARARHIETEIVYGDRTFKIRIRDDGNGIQPDTLQDGRPGHYGLQGMRERATRVGGTLDIWSRPAAGTEIEFNVAGSIAYRSSSSGRLLQLFRRKAG
jgi:signal transduction histidine kinase